MYANLIDANGNVIAVAPIMADGTFTFPDVPTNANLIIQLTTVAGVPGQPKPATVLPAGWVTTGENKNLQGGLTDPTANGEIILNTNNSVIGQQSFGIERLPQSNNATAIILTPTVGNFLTLNGGTNPPILTGSDPEDQPTTGVLTNKTIVITAVPTNTELYYNGVLVTAGQTINNFDANLLQVKFIAASIGTNSTSFMFAYVDAAGKADPTPATYTLNWLGIVPVKYLSFTATKVKEIAALNFILAQAPIASTFKIERSTNGNSFTEIGSLVSTTETNYNFEDKLPVLNTINYYRIKEIEINGTISFSEIRKLSFVKPTEINVYPNPTKDKINIDLPLNFTNKKATISIISADGKLISKQASMIPNKLLTIDLSALSNGTYVLIIETENEFLNKTIQILR